MSDALKKALNDYEIEKAGEGSRGGKIVGHTKSGKPIYEANAHQVSKPMQAPQPAVAAKPEAPKAEEPKLNETKKNPWDSLVKPHTVTVHYTANGQSGQKVLTNVQGRSHEHVHEQVMNALKKQPHVQISRLKIESQRHKDLKKAQIMTNVIGTNLNTNEASIDEMALKDDPWLEIIENQVLNLKSGDPLISIMLDDKELQLQKEDDGLFSAYLREADPKSGNMGALLMRLQKTGLPSIVQALKLKNFLPEMEVSEYEMPKLEPEQVKEANVFEQIEELVNTHEENWEELEGTQAEQSEDARMLELVRQLLSFKKSMELD
jgi:hypothetical protein